jgi:hypothetical protein
VANNLTYVNSVIFVEGKLYAAAEDRIVLLEAFGQDGRAGIVRTLIENLPLVHATSMATARARC